MCFSASVRSAGVGGGCCGEGGGSLTCSLCPPPSSRWNHSDWWEGGREEKVFNAVSKLLEAGLMEEKGGAKGGSHSECGPPVAEAAPLSPSSLLAVCH